MKSHSLLIVILSWTGILFSALSLMMDPSARLMMIICMILNIIMINFGLTRFLKR
jgi:hypothetical protein